MSRRLNNNARTTLHHPHFIADGKSLRKVIRAQQPPPRPRSRIPRNYSPSKRAADSGPASHWSRSHTTERSAGCFLITAAAVCMGRSLPYWPPRLHAITSEDVVVRLWLFPSQRRAPRTLGPQVLGRGEYEPILLGRPWPLAVRREIGSVERMRTSHSPGPTHRRCLCGVDFATVHYAPIASPIHDALDARLMTLPLLITPMVCSGSRAHKTRHLRHEHAGMG